ncbi:hypothetical protein JOC78_000860 [Bacillus ectoiniformans]|uniref:hypothetical protein n=1 Tax=Bacillus ectoiniformans TaxID=1494429 RepID=UPI00195B7B49|nr:hypothetical protein [Bacillus ectoiniformans]MBM7647920.1 hypothetical protein [Bacillus ectoiniformans]
MFDPTAYENLKFILQAEVYDKDLAGEVVILNRTDKMDLASLSRETTITFALTKESECQVTVRLYATLKQMAGELLNTSSSMPGAYLEVVYRGLEPDFSDAQMSCLDVLWGADRLVERRRIESDLSGVANEWRMDFNREITEEMIEEMEEFIDFIYHTLESLAHA